MQIHPFDNWDTNSVIKFNFSPKILSKFQHNTPSVLHILQICRLATWMHIVYFYLVTTHLKFANRPLTDQQQRQRAYCLYFHMHFHFIGLFYIHSLKPLLEKEASFFCCFLTSFCSAKFSPFKKSAKQDCCLWYHNPTFEVTTLWLQSFRSTQFLFSSFFPVQPAIISNDRKQLTHPPCISNFNVSFFRINTNQIVVHKIRDIDTTYHAYGEYNIP